MMMGRMMGGYSGGLYTPGLMEFITWILIMALLVTLIRYFWSKTK